ncbi:hypothetical protein IGI04_029602 [Brassica rapa subsp. trilocularis]|uniref:Aspartic peptidase DDI1-type domain-containing protein n=1 Tax=Brassica rapa subsp. trilocularis TaxID=1813537 RepID=A0ABQ7LQN7_BRACM|nr:hypothetical protein IGI04_029602 [Brassica rapa subsp. trilocularis]
MIKGLIIYKNGEQRFKKLRKIFFKTIRNKLRAERLREIDKDIELLFNKVSRKPKKTLNKEQNPGKFLISCSIHNHHLPNALCDIGSAVSIMAIDTAKLLELKMEPFKDSFTFVDSFRVNSADMIKNIKVEIGECIIPMDFHAMDIKSGKTSPLLFGRVFMATVGAICDPKRNKMRLTNVDETVFYDPMEKKKSEELISCIEKFEDPGPTVDSNCVPAIPESVSVDIRIAASSLESIDTKPSASVDTLRLSEQCEAEQSKSGGRTKNRKKKKNMNADAYSLSVVPLQFQKGSLENRVRCKGASEPFTKDRVLCDPELREKEEEPKLTSNTKLDTTACFGVWYAWDWILQTSLEGGIRTTIKAWFIRIPTKEFERDLVAASSRFDSHEFLDICQKEVNITWWQPLLRLDSWKYVQFWSMILQ